MRDDLANLLSSNTIGERSPNVPRELVGPNHRDQGRDRDQTPITLGQSGPLPDITLQDRLAELDELRRDLPDLAPGG